MSKICCTCKIEKDSFYNNKLSKDKLSAQCKDCSKKYRKEHKGKKYPSSTKEYRIEYISKNLNHINNTRRIRYSKNKPKYLEQNKINYSKHRDKRRASQSKYYYDNLNYYKERNKKYRNDNKEATLLRNRKRQKKIIAANITQKDINNLLLKFENKCFYCFCDIKRGNNLHLDHKIPLCRGGEHNINNIVPSCKTCNLRKGRKNPEEFIEYMKLCDIKGIKCQ